MKRVVIRTQAGRTGRSRAHGVLFDQELPFRGRREARRDTYNRRVKHAGRSWDQV